MKKVDISQIESVAKSNDPVCITKDGVPFLIAMTPDVYQEVLVTESVLERISKADEREDIPLDDVIKEVEEILHEGIMKHINTGLAQAYAHEGMELSEFISQLKAKYLQCDDLDDK